MWLLCMSFLQLLEQAIVSMMPFGVGVVSDLGNSKLQVVNGQSGLHVTKSFDIGMGGASV